METSKPAGERVLVVLDEPSLCRTLAEVLRAEGYQPIICTHPRYARAISEQVNLRLAFINLKLPEMSGLKLASKLKDQAPLLEVVFITCYRAFDNAYQAIDIDACDYLQKPFSTNHVRICLNRFQERQDLREKARLAEQRYYHLVQNLPLPIYEMHEDFKLESVNQTCAAMLGYTQEEAGSIPNWFMDRIQPEDRDRIGKLLDSALECGGAPFSVECRLTHKKGHLVHAIIKCITSSRYQEGHVETCKRPFAEAEKRRYPRGEVGWPCTMQTAIKSIRAEVRNIGLGGAFISCQHPPILNGSFQIIIEPPRRKSLSVRNEVVWSNFGCPGNERGKPRGIGTRFTEILDGDFQLLQEMISDRWQQ